MVISSDTAAERLGLKTPDAQAFAMTIDKAYRDKATYKIKALVATPILLRFNRDQRVG